MAFEHKPGSFSLFKNDRKEKDNQPDYTGNGKDLDGKDVRVAAWLKDGANGKFMSCKFSEPQQRKAPSQEPPAEPYDDSIPF